MFQSINSSVTKFAKYNKAFNHETLGIALNKCKELAKKFYFILCTKISTIIILTNILKFISRFVSCYFIDFNQNKRLIHCIKE